MEQLKALGGEAAKQMLTRRSATYEGIDDDLAAQEPEANASIGLAAVIVACGLSGLAGVYFEKVLKDSTASQTSLWVRNVQLSFYSLFPALFIGVVFKDGAEIAKEGFFSGYNWVVWTAITFQALGGIIVALVVNYADNIAKNFATSISILISCLASVFFFDFTIAKTFVVGLSIVLFATYLYSSPSNGGHLKPPPITIADYEKTTIGGDPSYFEIEQHLKTKHNRHQPSPIKGDARSSSRPATPTVERFGHARRTSEDRGFLAKVE
jgi:UDP-galactose transporter